MHLFTRAIKRPCLKERTMEKIDIEDVPMLDFDAGIPDSKWGETTTSATTGIVCAVVALLNNN